MILEASCDLTFFASAPIPCVLMLRPRSGLGQWVTREEYALEPFVPVVEFTDGFGNLCQRVVVPPGTFHIHAACCAHTADTIDVEPTAPFVPVALLPESSLQFLLPSRYCESDKCNALASQIVGNAPLGYAQVETIRQWIKTNLEYCYGASNASTSALETAESGRGVCRDFAHLGVALCRSLNIPARMVVGYLHELNPMDLHAWFEAFVGGRWFTFDATQEQPRGNRITIAYGRDAADVALVSQFGALQLQSMAVKVALARPSNDPQSS
ncbi:MAG TPA: transglutaminase family protein [Chthoniobacteraceae bacterium]|jgi:transglutaminase-like putative cysteine protease